MSHLTRSGLQAPLTPTPLALALRLDLTAISPKRRGLSAAPHQQTPGKAPLGLNWSTDPENPTYVLVKPQGFRGLVHVYHYGMG